MSQPIFLAQAAPAPASATTTTAPAAPGTASITVTSSTTPALDPNAAAPPWYTNFVPILLLLAFFYFAVMRPQQKSKEAQDQLLKKLKTGDRAVTSGGILGIISGFEENETVVVLKVSDNTRLKIKRSHITEVLVDPKEAKENATEVVKDASRDLARNKKPGGPR